MSKKGYFNFGDFNFVDGAIDLFHNTIRRAFDFDALSDDVFEAIVLTIPTPIADDPSGVAGIFSGDGFDNKKFSFRVRILGPLSPHRFLEDPCSLSDAITTADADYVFSIIQNHTQVFLFDKGGDTKPKVGDIVKIKLTKTGDSYDTRRAAQYMGIARDTPSTSSPGAATRADCEKLSTLFETFDFGTMNVSVDLTWLENFKKALNDAMVAAGLPPPSFSSGYRDAAGQANAMYKKPRTENDRLYGSITLPDGTNPNIPALAEAAVTSGNLTALTAAWQKVLDAGLGSKHNKGLAIDVRTIGLSDAQVGQTIKIIYDIGGAPFLEPVTTKCWSPSAGSSPPTTVKRLAPPGGVKGQPCYDEHIHVSFAEGYTYTPTTSTSPPAPSPTSTAGYTPPETTPAESEAILGGEDPTALA